VQIWCAWAEVNLGEARRLHQLQKDESTPVRLKCSWTVDQRPSVGLANPGRRNPVGPRGTTTGSSSLMHRRSRHFARMVGTSRCDVPTRVTAGGTNRA
jgi:hypothetical protein